MTEDCLTVSEKPEAIIVNYNNMGYARLRFDSVSQAMWIDNLRYVTDIPTRTYLWRTFKDMV